MSLYDAARSADYTLSTGEMAIALSTIPAARRNDAWLLALLAPLAAAGVREYMRHQLQQPLTSSLWTMAGPGLTGIAAAIGLAMSRQTALRPRATRCCY
ncbi:MAG TPA: hypothetical protein VFI53_06915 [Myxococcaceae bacterium]|nr:hypothetical protein [Myxococcaceae bacterium]